MKTMVQKVTATVRQGDHPKAMNQDRVPVAPAMPERLRNHPARRVIAVVNKAQAPVPVVAWNQAWGPRVL